jgi:hypothetical protein
MCSSGAGSGLLRSGVYTHFVRSWRSVRRAWRPWAVVALAVYAILLMANPLLHHDVACHVKSPTHCVACTSSPSAGRVEAAVPIAARPLPAAGHVERLVCSADDSAAILETTGRSPPA